MIKKKPVKELLGESLVELLGSKSFEKITISEITDNCGVGRRTFYNNFIDKYDLATWLYIRQLNEFVDSTDSARLGDFIRHSTEVVGRELDVIIALDKYRGQNSFRDSLTGPMTDIYVRAIEKFFECSIDEDMKKDIEFFVGGQIVFVGNIIESPLVPTPEEVTGFFIRCIPESLKKFV